MTYQQLRNIKYTLIGGIDSFFTPGTIRKANFPDKKVILAYHGIVNQRTPNKYNTKFVSRNAFLKQIVEMKTRFNFISIDQYVQNEVDPDRLNIVLTFDDGYLNNYIEVCPILDDFKIPASFFVTTAFLEGFDILWTDLYDLSLGFLPKQIEIDGIVFRKRNKGMFEREGGMEFKNYAFKKGSAFIKKLYPVLNKYAQFRSDRRQDDFWKLMTAEQVAEVNRNPLFTIGSHGNRHIAYPFVPEEEARSDMKKSKEVLEEIGGKKIMNLALPYGAVNRTTVEMALNCGYQFIFLDGYNAITKEYPESVWPRCTINPYLSAKNHILFIKKTLC